MLHVIATHLAVVVPLYVAVLWLGVTTLLGVMSGWFALTAQFPDRDDAPLLQLRRQSGMMRRLVNCNHVLVLAACPTGLRVSIWRLFGPFHRPFFVPWDQLTVARGCLLGWRYVELRFGKPPTGTLRLSVAVADSLAAAASAHWSERVAS